MFDAVLHSVMTGIAHPVVLAGLLLLATLLVEDLAILAGAALASEGRIDPLLAIAVLIAGIAIGDIALHLAGRWFGKFGWVVNRTSGGRAARILAWMRAKLGVAVFVARLLPGLRLGMYLASGIARVSFRRFALYVALAAVLWTGPVFLLSWGVGTALDGPLQWVVLAGLTLVIITLPRVLGRLVPAALARDRQ